MTSIDHLVIGAADLGAGVEYVNQVLGVSIPYGGEHEKMGTHNHLMQLGKDRFLEVIAINPTLPQPDRPRWYGLDNGQIQMQISQQPRLLTWVVNTADISALLKQAQFDFGEPALISRGQLSWQFGLPEDGNIFEQGTLPYVIQWNTDEYPAGLMSDQGCELMSLAIYHPDNVRLTGILDSINAGSLVTVYPTRRRAHITAPFGSPAGIKTLSSLF